MAQFLDPRLPDRFWSKCIPEPNSGCWLWFGANNGVGYGIVGGSRDGKRWARLAHRLTYETLVGAVPAGLSLDHWACQTPECCNPAHLEPVTHRVNCLRGKSPAASHAASTHCIAGHRFDDVNTRITPGRRACRACDRERARKYRSNSDAAL